MKAPRSASKTQAPAAARDGFVTYDELRGPDLDAARWSPARLPLATGGEHIPLDPNAELAVGEGEVRVTIPRFSLSHDRFQSADSAKYLTFSTRQAAVDLLRSSVILHARSRVKSSSKSSYGDSTTW